jgi:nucleotide-binding universal stress UspA family protein
MLLSNRRAALEETLELGIFPTRILLAIDGSEEAELAARKAVELAEATGAELHLVHVGLAPNFLVEGAPGYDRELYEQIEQEAREVLRKLAWRVKVAGGTPAGSHLTIGEVDLGIVGLARELGADLIVMGSRGHRGIRRAIAGSISDAVIRHAPCPVLVVRSRERAEVSEWATRLQEGSR